MVIETCGRKTRTARDRPGSGKKINMVEYCEFLKMAFAKILDFWRRLKTHYEAPKR